VTVGNRTAGIADAFLRLADAEPDRAGGDVSAARGRKLDPFMFHR